MIKSANITNFTAFNQVRLKPAPGLNVIIGENGAGKSHLLKLLYCVADVLKRDKKMSASGLPTKAALQVALADKLVGVLKPESLGRLARRRQGRHRCDVSVTFSRRMSNIKFGFATNSKTEVQIEEIPEAWLTETPVFLPTRELLSIFPNFVSVYEGHYLEFEETWRDTCLLLGAPLARGPRADVTRELLDPLEEAMGGAIVLDRNGRFYLNSSDGSLEISLVAEGLRKLGMIARLIATGKIAEHGYLFWDEPEASLNPKLVRKVAATIISLATSGIQVFIATHSLFLLRELEILIEGSDDLQTNFIGLERSANGISVSQSNGLEGVNSITALDEELKQSDRLLALE